MIPNRFHPLRVITTKIVENADGELERHVFCIRFFSHQQRVAKFVAGHWAASAEMPVNWEDAKLVSQEIDFEVERSAQISRRNDHDACTEPQTRRTPDDR